MQRHGLRMGMVCAAVFAVVLSGATIAAAQAPRRGACGQIIAACQQAGFERGGAKAGNGIAVDCIRPIMQARAQPRRATKPLPQIAPDVVAACSAANPNFGQRTGAAAQPAPGQPPEPSAPPAPPAAPGAPPGPGPN
jgi:hypothetical protein